MSKKQFITSLICILIAVLALDYFYLHILFPHKQQQINTEIESILKNKQKDDAKNDSPKESAPEILKSEIQQLNECFKNEYSEIFQNLIGHPQNPILADDAGQITILKQNWHFVDHSGKQTRVMKNKDEDYKIFDVDSENLPTLKMISLVETKRLVQKLSTEQILKNYQLTYQAIISAKDGHPGLQINTTTNEGKILELEVVGQSKQFSCASGLCHCR